MPEPEVEEHEPMADDWCDRVDAFWSTADNGQSAEMLQAMKALVDERPGLDGRGLYEWASVHDFLGLEQQAVPLYRAALDAGLDPEHEAQAVVQLASSLRNSGRPREAIALLEPWHGSDTVGAAPQAFLALALHDAGHTAKALQVALLALAPTLPQYQRAVARYASALTTDDLG